MVRRIFAEFVAGAPLGQIAHDLTSDGYATRESSRWHTSTVRRVLINPHYSALLPPYAADRPERPREGRHRGLHSRGVGVDHRARPPAGCTQPARRRETKPQRHSEKVATFRARRMRRMRRPHPISASEHAPHRAQGRHRQGAKAVSRRVPLPPGSRRTQGRHDRRVHQGDLHRASV
ncbi:recombinase family protein [Brevibacterium luteolum]|uniref:recombinase family protein n=1 Tax=Brevibacterium luteolum TaxID=199591 RepID=UPI0035CCE543